VSNELKLLIAIAAALWLVGRNLPAALLALLPSLWNARETEDDGSLNPETEPATEKIVVDLQKLGFAKLGAVEVGSRLGRSQAALVYGAPELHTFADLDGQDGVLRFTLFTPFEGGEAVLTSDYARPARNDPDALIGGLPAHDVPGVWAAHRRRVAQLTDGPLRPIPWKDVTLVGRVAAESRFYGGAGKRLLRARGMLPALMLVTAVLFTVLSVLQFIRLHAVVLSP
jgi:hypothetical protein